MSLEEALRTALQKRALRLVSVTRQSRSAASVVIEFDRMAFHTIVGHVLAPERMTSAEIDEHLYANVLSQLDQLDVKGLRRG